MHRWKASKQLAACEVVQHVCMFRLLRLCRDTGLLQHQQALLMAICAHTLVVTSAAMGTLPAVARPSSGDITTLPVSFRKAIWRGQHKAVSYTVKTPPPSQIFPVACPGAPLQVLMYPGHSWSGLIHPCIHVILVCSHSAQESV
jgi:hypothetical protein